VRRTRPSIALGITESRDVEVSSIRARPAASSRGQPVSGAQSPSFGDDLPPAPTQRDRGGGELSAETDASGVRAVNAPSAHDVEAEAPQSLPAAPMRATRGTSTWRRARRRVAIRGHVRRRSRRSRRAAA
jgi:hypothetical protein